MKKFLALVMALAMVMSLTVVSTSAKDFTDDDSITYTEAIDVISALEIMDGYTDGSFQPNTQLNRGQAAKIICNLILGVAAADNLTATRAPFPDVPASHIFAGYISYCAQEGIISGYSDGYFRPGDTLSGYAFMKMLLGALGYDQTNEGLIGTNWTIQCAKLVQGIGLDANLDDDFIGSKTVTREEAALYALNTLQARTVEYVVPGSTISVNGIEINQKASNASYRVYDVRDRNGATADKGSIDSNGYIEFAEEHFPRLERTSTTEGFGRPSRTWTYKGDKVGEYTMEADEVYEEYVTMADLYSDLGLTSTTKYFKVYIDGTSPSKFYPLGRASAYEDNGPDWLVPANGKLTVDGDYDIVEIDSNDIADVNRIGAGPGSVIEVYKSGVPYDKTNAAGTAGTIVVFNTYIGEVIAVNEAEGKHKANIEIAPVGDFYDDATAIDGNSSTLVLSGAPYGDTYDTEKFDVGDMVTFNYQYNLSASKASVKAVAVAETVDGEVKEYSDEDTFVLDSTEYKYSKMAPQKIKSEDIGTDIVAYLDGQGNVLYFDEGEDNYKNFALVLDAGARSAVGGNSYEAELLYTDGTVETVRTDKQYGGTGLTDAGTDNTCIIGRWVTFREKSNGQYVLTTVKEDTAKSPRNMMKADHTAQVVTAGATSFKIGDTSTQSASVVELESAKVRVNSNTLIIVKTKTDRFKVYHGVKELPQITQVTPPGTGRILYSAMTKDGQSYAKFLYVDASHEVAGTPLIDVRNRSNNDIYLVGRAYTGNGVDSNGNTYYAFKGVVDGTVYSTKSIKLNWNDNKTQKVIDWLLTNDDLALALCNYSVEGGTYEVALDDAFGNADVGTKDNRDKGVHAFSGTVDKVTADVIEIGGETWDLTEDCQFFRVSGKDVNIRVDEMTWKGIHRGTIGTGSADYTYVALSLNRDYEVTAVYWRLNK